MATNTPTNFPTSKQIPDHSIMDFYGKQCYLGNQYVVAQNLSIGGSETPFLLFSNSTTTLSLFISSVKALSLTSGNNVILRVYQNPTVTGAGTAATVANLRPASTSTSKATVTYSPSVSANGTLIDTVTSSFAQSGLSQLLSIIDPTMTYMITATASASSTSTDVIVSWYEL